MKATGIVRRIDDLGRIVIPKEIRRTLHIRESDPLEIYTVFPSHRDFSTIMMAYPLSLSVTALLIFIALMVYRPSRRFAH